VPPPTPEGADALACATLKAQLPEPLDGLGKTATSPQSAFVTAWGDPAVVLRCGVPTPTTLEPTSQLITIDGVAWFPEQLERGYLFTTVGRAVNVEVSVPDAYSPEADKIVPISAAVAATIAETPAG
jgi:hypothetical protein